MHSLSAIISTKWRPELSTMHALLPLNGAKEAHRACGYRGKSEQSTRLSSSGLGPFARLKKLACSSAMVSILGKFDGLYIYFDSSL